MRSNVSFLITKTRRAGVSVIEVLFAMGVVVIGLLGIMAIIPLSSKNTADSLHLAESQAFSNEWYSEFSARGMNFSGSWLMQRDFTTPQVIMGFNKQLAATWPAIGCTPPSANLVRELGRESVCLDPYLFTHRSVEFPSTSTWASTIPRSQSNWYRPAVFPYYQNTYNPLVDTAFPVGSGSASIWEAQPRMVRVTLPNFAGSPLSLKNLEQMFMSTDDVSITTDVPALDIDDKDATIPPMRVGQANSKFTALNNYSWLATMSPSEPIPALSTASTNYYTISLVVVHNRDMTMFDPAITATRAGAAEAPRPEDKPQGERLFWVEPVSGDFVGGNGGRVRLITSDGTKDELSTGNWVMLSRVYAAVPSGIGTTLRPFTVFRWYRIIAVEQAEEGSLLAAPPLPLQVGTLDQVTESGTTTDPYGNTPATKVWGKTVVLEGPDWNFTTPVAGLVTPTTATVVKGATTVIERVVTVY